MSKKWYERTIHTDESGHELSVCGAKIYIATYGEYGHYSFTPSREQLGAIIAELQALHDEGAE